MIHLKPQTHRVHVERHNFGRNIDVHIVQHNGNDELVAVASSIVFVKVDDDSVIPPPALSMHPEVAQRLVDEFWRAGFRPTQGQQSEGQIAAVNTHLQDMRHMVSKLSKVPLPGVGGQ